MLRWPQRKIRRHFQKVLLHANLLNIVREVIVMGGTLILPGNVTPLGGIAPSFWVNLEFNIATDPEAASLLFSLTSTTSETHPSAPRLPRRLRLYIAPLDCTHLHGLRESFYKQISSPLVSRNSPLATFLDAILNRTYRRIQSLVAKGRESEVVELHMHDPLCIYFAMLDDATREQWIIEKDIDVRVECKGTWTRGMTVLDRRIRGNGSFVKNDCEMIDESEDTADADYEGVDDDEGVWRGSIGNRVNIIWASSAVEGGNLATVERMAEMIWRLKS